MHIFKTTVSIHFTSLCKATEVVFSLASVHRCSRLVCTGALLQMAVFRVLILQACFGVSDAMCCLEVVVIYHSRVADLIK